MTDADLRRLGQHVAQREDARLDASSTSESTRRFLAEYSASRSGCADERRKHPPGSGRTRRTGLWLGLAALVVAVVFGLTEAVFRRPPLSFTIGSPARIGVLREWESAADDAPLPIRFSDGTLIELEPKARARVVEMGGGGAQIVIESGRAHLAVVPVNVWVPGESPWRISLGPFSVEVKGTRFDVEWDPRTDDFALDLFEGTVQVSGCQERHSHTLVAGQGVRASCSKQQWTLVSVPGAASSRAAELAAPAPESRTPSNDAGAPALDAIDDRDAPRPPATRGRTRGATPPRSWQALARSGHYAPAYQEVQARFEAECERVPAADLPLLGDTARLNGDVERARMAYLAARQRFAGHPAAARAAFALGLLAVKSDPNAAMVWFERYLSEAPGGPLAAAAHDWLFELIGESGTLSRRREVARRYLRDHPDGAHARDAQRIVDANQSR